MQTLTDIGTLIVRTPGTCGGRPRTQYKRVITEKKYAETYLY
ncbi:hypothetical protein [Coleofasciculus sp. LEGE 07092]|nr:hypothetical protein [Coleofasciculus sp. LEGE 07092]